MPWLTCDRKGAGKDGCSSSEGKERGVLLTCQRLFLLCLQRHRPGLLCEHLFAPSLTLFDILFDRKGKSDALQPLQVYKRDPINFSASVIEAPSFKQPGSLFSSCLGYLDIRLVKESSFDSFPDPISSLEGDI